MSAAFPACLRRARWHAALVATGIALAACGQGPSEAARDEAKDETSEEAGPAQRVVTLAPHLAELVFTAGAGERLIGVVDYSDFPPPVRELPRVGDAFRVDYEAVTALAPDLILAWTSGNPPETVQRLRNLGFRVVTLEPTQLGNVATQIEQIGELTGGAAKARAAADEYRARLARLRERSAGAATVSVFVQLSERPWFTVTDRHFLGQGLQLCGGRNVFGALPGITAIVSLEAIVAAAPEVIVVSDMGADSRAALTAWNAWQDLPAVNRGHLYLVDADLLSRPSARILDGVEALCADLDRARGR